MSSSFNNKSTTTTTIVTPPKFLHMNIGAHSKNDEEYSFVQQQQHQRRRRHHHHQQQQQQQQQLYQYQYQRRKRSSTAVILLLVTITTIIIGLLLPAPVSSFPVRIQQHRHQFTPVGHDGSITVSSSSGSSSSVSSSIGSSQYQNDDSYYRGRSPCTSLRMSSSMEDRTIVVNGDMKVNGEYDFDASNSSSNSDMNANANTYANANTNANTNTRNIETPRIPTWYDSFGTSALRQVQNLASVVSEANEGSYTSESASSSSSLNDRVVQAASERQQQLELLAAQAQTSSFGDDMSLSSSPSSSSSSNRSNNNNSNNMSGDTVPLFSNLTEQRGIKGQNRKVVLSALESLERDMQLLDNIAASKPQLTPLELTLLSLSVAAASSGPIFFAEGAKVAEVLAPAAAAFSAAIGIGAEYTGRVAVADGKEVAASTMQCAAEAEGLLANAERVKAITPLCVGIGALAATSSLVAPVLIESLNIGTISLVNELYLLSPLASVLSAAVASLALQETKSYSSRAISVGNRRFAKSGLVGRTWLSASEQVERNSQRTTQRWRSFSWSVLPAPIIGSLIPGAIPTKAVVVTAIGAAQSAFYLSECENVLARATDAVALKARSAAVCDTYANQGARSAAILPFTSALSSLCAAATAAIVELPWLESLAGIGGLPGTISSVALVAFFPSLSSLFAAAASVSKARCEVDAEAAIQAAATLALEYGDGNEDKDPVLRPFRGVAELIRLSVMTGWKSFRKTRLSKRLVMPFWSSIQKIFRR